MYTEELRSGTQGSAFSNFKPSGFSSFSNVQCSAFTDFSSGGVILTHTEEKTPGQRCNNAPEQVKFSINKKNTFAGNKNLTHKINKVSPYHNIFL